MTRKTLFHRSAFGGMTANERRLGRFLRDGAGHPDPAPGGAPTDDNAADAAFAAAFAAEAAETPPTGASDDPAPAGGGGVDAPAPAAGAADEPAAVVESAPAEPAPAEPAPAEPAPAEAAPQLTPEQVLEKLAGLVQPQAPAAPAAPVAEAPADEAPPVYTAEEQAQIAEYEQNWPDVARAESLKRKGEYGDLLKYVFAEVANYFAPFQQQLTAIGNNLHMGELKAAVPDYTENLEVEVRNWIDSQPAYLQAPYKQVMQSGTSDEVADLIGRYRSATGAAPAPQAQAPSPAPAAAKATPPAPPKTELSSAAKQAAELLAPVGGERSQVPQGEDPGDFDSAFARYAATM